MTKKTAVLGVMVVLALAGQCLAAGTMDFTMVLDEDAKTFEIRVDDTVDDSLGLAGVVLEISDAATMTNVLPLDQFNTFAIGGFQQARVETAAQIAGGQDITAPSSVFTGVGIAAGGTPSGNNPINIPWDYVEAVGGTLIATGTYTGETLPSFDSAAANYLVTTSNADPATTTTTVIPEPATMIALAIGGMAMIRRRRA